MKDTEIDASDNTPKAGTEQEGAKVLFKAWVDAEVGAEISDGLREFFRTDNVSESLRLVLKGFVRIKGMRDALHEDMAVALIGARGKR